MKFPFFIAKRYLFSKKSHHAINIISAISVGGVAIATMAMVCTLSVFNGFQQLVASFFTEIDPQLKVMPYNGKTFDLGDSSLLRIKDLEEIAVYTPVLEEQAMVITEQQQVMVTVKGVDDNYNQLTHIDNLLYGEGKFILHSDVLEYGIVGIQLAAQLGLGIHYDTPLNVYAPREGERVSLTQPAAHFRQAELFSPGVVFGTKQSKYDAHYIITSLPFAQHLFGKGSEASAIELKLKDGCNIHRVKKEIQGILGDRFVVKDRYEQQEDVFRIMEIEKLIAYLFLSFILMVACFNIIGSVSMLVVEKKNDIRTLQSMGAADRQISLIFLMEGGLISGLGAIGGIVTGIVLCLVQQVFGIIKLGGSSGSFIVDAYPVKIEGSDLLLIFVTVLAVSYIAMWFPIKRLSKKLLQ